MNQDVLVISVPIEGAYPSAKNQTLGPARYGKKSPAYHDVFEKVVTAGKAALADGWEPLKYKCRVTVDRYVPDARLRDAINLGQVEFDALTRAGVWTDDSLANPVLLSVLTGADGIDRVVVTIHRLPPGPGIVKPREALPVQAKRRRGPKAATSTEPPKPNMIIPPVGVGTVRARYNGTDIPEGMALLGDKLIPRAEALAILHGEKK